MTLEQALVLVEQDEQDQGLDSAAATA